MNKLRHFYCSSLTRNVKCMKVSPKTPHISQCAQFSCEEPLFCDRQRETYFSTKFRQKNIPAQQCSLLYGTPKRFYGLDTTRNEFKKSTIEAELEDHVGKSNRDILEDIYEETVYQRSKIQSEGGWMIRLANENGYLSWCRNTYLASAVAVACFSQGSAVPYAPYAADILFLMGGLNLTLGTVTYVSQLVQLRDVIYMSRLTTLTHSSMAILHLLLWFTAVIVYMGYGDEDDIVIVATKDPDCDCDMKKV
ncbi:unnamed protein product [Owenia fusiformis]|uniref:Uncharacterized protein n=1 Tax=Owenia fusiformis TaxID=6347 RepID=A0A8J1XVC8_OWEFU|nr:unnamed protein product [Owenia fusiformis]